MAKPFAGLKANGRPNILVTKCFRGVSFGIDSENMMYVLYRDFSRTRTLSRTHVAKTTGKAIPSPYAFGLVPAFV